MTHHRNHRIRPIRREDNPAVAQVIRTVMTEFGAVGAGYSIEDPEVDSMFEAYAVPRADFWVVTLEEQVLGCGGVAPLPGGDEHTCELQKMYFLDALRGRGIGQALLNHCLQRAIHHGYRRCYLETLGSMTAARRLYRRNGFRDITGALGATGHSGCDRWMVLDLAEKTDGPEGRPDAPGERHEGRSLE